MSSNKPMTFKVLKKRLAQRLYRAVDYLSIYVFIIVVYGGAVVTDYILFSLLWRLLSEEVQKYPLISLVFDYARIGVALFFLFAALVHGIISTYNLIKLDMTLSREGKRSKK